MWSTYSLKNVIGIREGGRKWCAIQRKDSELSTVYSIYDSPIEEKGRTKESDHAISSHSFNRNRVGLIISKVRYILAF